jgi:hypothetical protein
MASNRTIAINLTGPFLLTCAVLLHMIARHSGVINNTASESSLRGGTGGPAYTTSKHGLVGLARSWMLHYRLSCPSEPSFPSLPLSEAPRNELLGALHPERDREDITWFHPLHQWLVERPHEGKWVRCRMWHPLSLKEPVLAQVDG